MGAWLGRLRTRFQERSPCALVVAHGGWARCPCLPGCLNGRGQAHPEDRALLGQMEALYAAVPIRSPESSAHVQELYREWLNGADSSRAQEALHTAHQGPGQPVSGRDIKW